MAPDHPRHRGSWDGDAPSRRVRLQPGVARSGHVDHIDLSRLAVERPDELDDGNRGNRRGAEHV